MCNGQNKRTTKHLMLYDTLLYKYSLRVGKRKMVAAAGAFLISSSKLKCLHLAGVLSLDSGNLAGLLHT